MSDKVKISVGGMGLIVWLIVLGTLGIGPCSDCMRGCGPVIDVPKMVQSHQAERP